MHIRIATSLDKDDIHSVHWSAFAEDEREIVSKLAVNLLSEETTPQTPLGVKPDYQKRRIGSKLIESGMQQLSRMGVDILFVYGDPKYYSRFGFSVDAAEYYIPHYRLEYPFGWQGVALSECSIRKSPVKIACVTSLCDPALW